MDIFNSDYWKLVRILQKATGCWHFYDKKWKFYIPWIYVYLFTISFMIAMGVRLYNEIGVNVDIVIENVTGEGYLCIVFSKLTLNIIYAKKIKYLYTQIARDWKVIVDEEELKVMHIYTEIGRKVATVYSGYMIIGVIGFMIMPVTTPLLDYIIPLENATRPKALPYYAEYGIDQEKYYYPLIAQAVFGSIGTMSVLVTYDLEFIMIVQHVVALFALVNFRLRKVEEISEMIEKRSMNYDKGNLYAYKKTISAIQLHQTVLEYVDLVEGTFNIAWLIVLFLNMVMLGGGFAIVMTFDEKLFFKRGSKKIESFENFFTLFTRKILMKLDRPEEVVRYAVAVGAALIHFYYVFLPGQKIINCSSEVFDACYACRWYNLSEKTKTSLKIMMSRSLRRCELTGGKMFILCMETYSNMMKTGLSIFTVLNANE